MAAGLAEALKKEFGTEARLIPGDGGVFDVTVDGALIYSKHETGRHIRDPREIIELIHEMQDS